MGLGFVTVYSIQRFNLPLASSATFTAIMMGSEILGFSIWGFIADKRGYKRVIEYCSLFMISGLLGLIFFKAVWGIYLVFTLISIAHAGEYIADQNIAMEFGDEADRPTYIGMSKTLTGPVLLVSPLLGGGLVKFWGYQRMFLIALLLSIIAFVLIKFFVKEPRTSQ
jgi:MFS family permease